MCYSWQRPIVAEVLMTGLKALALVVALLIALIIYQQL